MTDKPDDAPEGYEMVSLNDADGGTEQTVSNDNNTREDAGIELLACYVRDGPDAGGDNIALRILGFYLWWESWAMISILMAGVFLTGLIESPPIVPRFWGFTIGVVTVTVANAVSGDKYGI